MPTVDKYTVPLNQCMYTNLKRTFKIRAENRLGLGLWRHAYKILYMYADTCTNVTCTNVCNYYLPLKRGLLSLVVLVY